MIESQRLEDLVMARLSVGTKSPPSLQDLERTLGPFVASQLTPKEWREELTRALSSLRDSGAIDAKRLLLTEVGRQRLARALGLEHVPATKNWTEFKKRHLRRLIANGEAEAAGHRDPALSIVARELGLPAEAAGSSAKLGNAWLAKFLGVPAHRLSIKTLRAALLAREFKLSERMAEEKLVGQLAVKFTGAKSGSSTDVVEALASRWLLAGRPASVPAPSPMPEAEPSEGDRLETSPRSVIGKIRAALRSPGAKHYGENKVFIGSVWQALHDDPDVQRLGEDGFKRVLVEAHQRGDLTLSRADLISAMDPADVVSSEIQHLNATYHFIQTPRDQP